MKCRFQEKVAAPGQAAGDDGGLDAAAGDLDLGRVGEVQIPVDLAQGQNRHAQRPEAELAQAGLVARNQHGVFEGIAQMAVGDGDQLLETFAKPRVVVSGLEHAQVEAGSFENVSRQPSSPIMNGSRLRDIRPQILVWWEGSIKSGPTLNGWTFRPRTVCAAMIPLATVVFPHPLCVPAITIRGIVIIKGSRSRSLLYFLYSKHPYADYFATFFTVFFNTLMDTINHAAGDKDQGVISQK